MMTCIMAITSFALFFAIRPLLPKQINLTYAYIDDQDTLTRASQALGSELFLNPEKVKSVQHDGNLDLMVFTGESGFFRAEGSDLSLDEETLVQVFVLNASGEEVADTLHVQEVSGRQYDVHVASKDGIMTIVKEL